MKKIYIMLLSFLISCILISCEEIDNIIENEADVRVILSTPIDPVGGVENPENEKFEFISAEWQKREIPNDLSISSVIEMVPANNWDVHIVNGKVMVSRIANRFDRFRFDLEDGYFISENRGVRRIDFIGEDGINYTVVECNPRRMFSINGAIYLIEGTHDRGVGWGNIYRLVQIDGKWQTDKKVDLGGYPLASYIQGGYIFLFIELPNIVEGDQASEIIRISLLDQDMKVERLLNTYMYHSMGANSMVKKDNVVYIGFTYGLVTINLDNDEIQFYTKGID